MSHCLHVGNPWNIMQTRCVKFFHHHIYIYTHMTKCKTNVKLKQHYFARPFSHMSVHCSRAGVLLWRLIHSNQCNNPQWMRQRTRAPPTGVHAHRRIRQQHFSATRSSTVCQCRDQAVLVLDRKGQEFSDMCEMRRSCCYNVRGLRCCWRLEAREMFTLGLDVVWANKHPDASSQRGLWDFMTNENTLNCQTDGRVHSWSTSVFEGLFPHWCENRHTDPDPHWWWKRLKQILLLLGFIHQWWCSKRNECFSS